MQIVISKYCLLKILPRIVVGDISGIWDKFSYFSIKYSKKRVIWNYRTKQKKEITDSIRLSQFKKNDENATSIMPSSSALRLFYMQSMSSLALIITLLWANSADNKVVKFSYFSQKTGSDISCKLSPMETICRKCQILFPGQNKKNNSKCPLLKNPRVLSVKSKYSIVHFCLVLYEFF